MTNTLSKNNRISKSQLMERIIAIQEWMAMGTPTHEIIKKGVKIWNVSERQIHKYIKKANESLLLDAKEDTILIRGQLLNKYNILYKEAYTSEALKENERLVRCESITEKISDLLGVKVHKKDITQNNNTIIVGGLPEELIDNKTD